MNAKDKRKIVEAQELLSGMLENFMPKAQIETLRINLRGEEKMYFADLVAHVAGQIRATPVTYGQEGKGELAIVGLHYSGGGGDAWIIERDKGEGEGQDGLGVQHQAFGRITLNDNYPEIGYISVDVLLINGFELDLYWTPKALKAIS